MRPYRCIGASMCKFCSVYVCVAPSFLTVVYPCSLTVDQMTLPPAERMGLSGCGKACSIFVFKRDLDNLVII